MIVTISCYGKVINFEAFKANYLASALAFRFIWLFVLQQVQKWSFSTTFKNNKKHTSLPSNFLIKKNLLNLKFYIYSNRQALSFPFTKKICHQTTNGLNNYHSIRAMLANPKINQYLTERHAWETRHFNGMKHNLPPFHMFFYISVEPANSTGKILHPLHSLEVKSRPNCLGRSWNPTTERPERQLHSWKTMFPYIQYWRSNHRQIISHSWFLSEVCLNPPS